jgi:hypothetical protein
MKKIWLGMLALTIACTAARQPSAPKSAARNPEFKNVQLLSHEMSRDELIEVMRSFNQALGVRCDHCHVVVATEPKPDFNFPSDEKQTKRIARVMIGMTQQINGEWLERVEAIEGEKSAGQEDSGPAVRCWTCHRGKTEPESAAASGARD